MKHPLFVVPGTWGAKWALPGSLCRLYLDQLGFEVIVVPWSYDVDGTPNATDYDADDYGGNSDWGAGGRSFRYQLHALIATRPELVRVGAIDVMTHSHGIEPPIYQATLPPMEDGLPALPIRNLISICAPPRKDVSARYEEARRTGMIQFHRAVYADGWDFMARLGQAFDGSWGWKREWKGADENVGLKGIGHSGLLMNEKFLGLLGVQLRGVRDVAIV